MKIAFVYDRVNKWGGAERILLSLHKIWPKAPLYTAVYDKKKAPWADDFHVIPSFLNRFPFASSKHELYASLTPFAFESFNFDDYDVVLSVTSSDAKGIVTGSKILHICYCLTPSRYLWSGYREYLKEPGLNGFNLLARTFLTLFSTPMRRLDYLSSYRVNKYIAISKTVAQRIKVYYKKKVSVIYPPVNTSIFKPSETETRQDYFLVVGRLVPYKRIDFVISVFDKLDLKLKVVGRGMDESRLRRISNNKNIEFISGDLTDEKLSWYYQNCQALIFAGEEDFGLTSVEAQSCGRPVIGIGRGGVKETIIPGRTGEFFRSYNKRELASLLLNFKVNKYPVSVCRQNALRFSEKKFQEKIYSEVIKYWRQKL